MTIDECVRIAESTKACMIAQEFRGRKYALVTTMTVKKLCNGVIGMSKEIDAMRSRVVALKEGGEA